LAYRYSHFQFGGASSTLCGKPAFLIGGGC